MKILAKGGDGQIFQKDNRVVKKFYKKEFFDNEKGVQNFSHPFIIKPLLINEEEMSIEYNFYKKGALYPCYNLEKVIKMLFQISDSAAYIDAHGLYYSDLSPKNIVQTDDGDYILIDFGRLQSYGNTVSAPKNYIEYSKKIGVNQPSDYLFKPSIFLVFTALWYYSGTFIIGDIKNLPPVLKKMYDWALEKRPSILGLRNYIFNCFEEPKKYALQEAIHLSRMFDLVNSTNIFGELDKEDVEFYKKNYQYR